MRFADELPVYRGGVLCGTLSAVPTLTRFRYAPEFPPTELPGGGIATSLPRAVVEVETPGRFLPPFFENLLPEGFRAAAVRQARRIAADDAYGLLSAVGGDTIGDVYAAVSAEPALDDDGELDFEKLLEREVLAATSVAGVQPKISDRGATIVREGRDLLKLAPPEYPGLVENEALVMEIARRDCRIPTADARIVRDRRGVSALSVRRFDRLPDGTRLHQEDGCQILGRYAGAKYDVPLREVLSRARELSTSPQVVSLRWLALWAFSYLIGNGDLHLKNLSLHQTAPGQGLVPTPAYDLVSTLLYPELDPKMALQMDGKDDNLRAKSFVAFFGRYGLPEPLILRTLGAIATGVDRRLDELGSLAPTPKARERAVGILRRRADRL